MSLIPRVSAIRGLAHRFIVVAVLVLAATTFYGDNRGSKQRVVPAIVMLAAADFMLQECDRIHLEGARASRLLCRAQLHWWQLCH